MPNLAALGSNVERIGHRGAPRRFLENTQPSFAEALRLGADGIELDVHVTANGAVVVHHDPTLSGTVLPAALRRRPISQLSSRDLAGVDLGSGARIPLLSDVLALVRQRAAAYVEIKAGDVEAVISTVVASGAKCAVHSFDHAAVAEVRRYSTDLPTGVLLEKWPRALDEVVAKASARDVWPKATLITEARIDQIHALGCRAIAWTVNDLERARQLASWGTDGICTDDLTLL